MANSVLRRFDILCLESRSVSDPTQVPMAGAVVRIYGQGATSSNTSALAVPSSGTTLIGVFDSGETGFRAHCRSKRARASFPDLRAPGGSATLASDPEVTMSATRTLTLADVAAPRAGTLSNAALIVGASLVTALAAQIAIPLPWSPVPITGQTFAVLLSGAVLGARRAFLAQLLYLAEGAIGLPVFAGLSAGIVTLAGPTGGYLLAFPFAAAVTGFLAERGWDRRFVTMLAALLLGSAVIFASGLAGLSRFLSNDQLLGAGLLPFLPGDLIKSSLAALAFPALWRAVRRHEDRA